METDAVEVCTDVLDGYGGAFVAAFEDVETPQVQNRDLLQLLASGAEELKLAENGRDAKELQAISTDAVAQATAKLP